MSVSALDNYYLYGEIHDAIDAVDHLETMLIRLRRRHLIDEITWAHDKVKLAEIRHGLEKKLSVAN